MVISYTVCIFRNPIYRLKAGFLGSTKQMPFCPYCGHSLEPDLVYCPSCGKRLPTQSTSVPQPPYPGGPSYLGPPPSLYGETDRKALGRLWNASIIFLAMFVIGIAVDVVFISQFSRLFTFTPTVGGVGAPPNFHFGGVFYTYLIIFSAVTGAVENRCIVFGAIIFQES